jgi:DNA repair ATPase RecN
MRDQRAGGGRPASVAALAAADFDPAELERIEERLFALRAASRKYSTPVDGSRARRANTPPTSR